MKRGPRHANPDEGWNDDVELVEIEPLYDARKMTDYVSDFYRLPLRRMIELHIDAHKRLNESPW